MLLPPSYRSTLAAIALAAILAESAPAEESAPPTAPADSAATAPRDSTATGIDAPAIATRLLALGFENVGVRAESLSLAYENRRYRHSAEALGLAHAAAGLPAPAFERRLGMVAARLAVADSGGTRFSVRYPSDSDFPRRIGAELRSPTFRRVDLEIGPLLDYRIGQIFNPLEARIELQPRVRLNPWPGAAVQLGFLIPVFDDYPAADLDLDAGRVRPGRMSLDQFAWAPGGALVSASAGYFGDHRWGAAFGASRPLAEGAVLLDAQIERTGYVAFADSGTFYSIPRATSGHVGVSVRPGYSDVAVRAQAARFLYGDNGVELEVRRSLGDLDLAYFAQRTVGVTTFGIRLDLPVPPMRRSSGNPVRIQPVPRFSLSFRDASELFGTAVSGIGSREDYLRQLNRPALEASADRYRRARGTESGSKPGGEAEWVSLAGTTGFIQTPWAGVMADRGLEAGYNFIPRDWAYDHRGRNDNQVYYATLGFLPRVETSLRWTRIPGYRSFEEIAPDSRLVDIDRMSSGRIELLSPRPGRPGLAAGIEDVQGTRRFHSAYLVTGMPGRIFLLHWRGSLGYGFRTFVANRYVLDGLFGALECVPTRYVRVQLEHDSEKVNAAVGIEPGAGFRIRAAILNLEKLSFGAGWTHAL